MYFSKQKRQTYINKVLLTYEILYKMEVKTQSYSINELEEMINFMFSAWNRIIRQKENNFIKNFSGYLRRFILDYDTDSQLYTPRFLFLLLTSPRLKKPIDYHLELNTKITWTREWANTIKNYNDITCNINPIPKDNVPWEIYKFIDIKSKNIHTKNKESKRYIIIKNILEKHRIFAEGGTFKTKGDKNTKQL